MRLVRNSRVALAAAGALALGGTAMTVPPAPPLVVAPVTLTDGVLSLGEGGVIDVDDTHKVTGPDGTDRWELSPEWDTAQLTSGSVHWSLTGVAGPGILRVTEPDDSEVGGDREDATDGEPLVRFDSSDGLPDGYDLPTAARGATRWSFDAPGTYTLIFAAQMQGEVEDRPLVAEASYTVRVGDAAVAQPQPEPEPVVQPSTEPVETASAPPVGRRVAAQAPNLLPAAEPVETAKKVLGEGHIDIAARVVDGRLQIHVKDGTVPGKTVWREPSSVVLHVKPGAKKTIPANKDFAFLGKAGDPIWLLDQVQQPGLLWPGWSTDNMAAGATKGEVEFKLVKTDGPGNFALYNYDGLSGATVRFNSGDGVPDAFGVPQNTHAHGGWAFGKEGVYRLTFTMSATLADGTKTSDTETLAFSVGAGDPNQVPPGGTGGGSMGGSTGGSTGGTTGGSTGGTTGGDTSGSTGGGSATGGVTGGSRSATGGSMANTGSKGTLLLAGTAAALAVAGAGTVVLTRRRTS
ncbi:choice-of-anchor M domain-containing protein [Streptomyces sp. NBC_01320]|uniref:choice-of-anchor M domain-containing protein n=1 Tax=Streptomyces sp. NBC_01320 TaxID=2903824 RepID=UPI002E165385|nr:choice-of-anchor M domain-containing protein [Streptomyces sp. NBC_01320]WSK00996.1 choice-of-anchor M domain-containing protein [Streptomyces sp. NBC_01320]